MNGDDTTKCIVYMGTADDDTPHTGTISVWPRHPIGAVRIEGLARSG
jgi:hypothetical protein